MKAFKPNDFPTLGVEEEFHLIDPETAELMPRVDAVMDSLEGEMRERVCYELLQCVLEGRSPVCRTVDDLVENVGQGRRTLAEACSERGVRLVASGSHPFGSWREMPFIDTDHYRWVRENHGYVAHRLLAFALHIHVGLKSAEAALYVMHEMRRWAYPLTAMAANSPYYEGLQTGLASTRIHLFHSMPRSRFAPRFASFSELEDYYDKLVAAGDITRPGDLWWCIRPQPPLGTIEYRFFDLPTSVKRIGVFAAIVQAASAFYQERFLSGVPATVLHDGYLEQNWWRALRDGLQADFVDSATGDVKSAREQVGELLTLVAPKAEELHTARYLADAWAILREGTEAEGQITLCGELNNDFRALELALAERSLDGC